MSEPSKLQIQAENLIKSIGLGPHNGHHITKTNNKCLRCFSAAGELLSYCQDGLSELLVPNNTVEIDVGSWLDSHEKNMQAALMKSLADGSLAAYDLALENHPLTEALIQLAPSYAIKRLALFDLVPDEAIQDENAEGSALLISALRILPKLAYYRMADKFRLELLENESGSDKITELYWKDKRTFTKVTTNNLTWDFLTDKRVVTNRPHLSAFLGIVLHYEILNRKDEDGMQANLRKMARETSWPAGKWQDALRDHLGIERIVSDPLLEYFHPLYDYMDQTETIKQVIVPINPRTTTTTSTTTSTMSPTEFFPETTVTQSQNGAIIEIKGSSTKAPVEENKEIPENSHAHTAAIAGALIGIFALLILVGIVGNRFWSKRRRPR